MDYKEITNRIDELNLDGYKHIKNNNWSCPEELIKWLINKNFEVIGGGLFSKVFQSPTEKFVVKVNIDPSDGEGPATDIGYQKFLNLCEKNKGNPHLPKIGKPKIIKSNGKTYNVVFIEKLDELDVEFSDAIFFIQDIVAFCNNDIEKKEAYQKMAQELTDDQYKQSVEIINLLQGQDNNITYDLHEGNFMMRKNTLVVIDPFYQES